MIKYYKTNDILEELDHIEKGTWIHMLDPEPEEIRYITEYFDLDDSFIPDSLDEEESARIDCEDGNVLILVNMPTVQAEGNTFVYETVPLGIILTKENIITVCLEESSVIEDFFRKRVRSFDTCKRTRFLLQLLFKNAQKFLQYLRQIEKSSTQVEDALHKNMKNKDLIKLLKIEKSLVYFSTALKANEIVLEKMLKSSSIKYYPDDTDLLEDVIIENKQAIEMCTIYRDIVQGTTEAFASVISNNLNAVMRFLTVMTIVIAVPTFITSLWGINVPVPFERNGFGFWIVIGISAVCTIITVIWLWRKKML